MGASQPRVDPSLPTSYPRPPSPQNGWIPSDMRRPRPAPVLLGAEPSSLCGFLKAHLGLGRMAGTEQMFTLTLSHQSTDF